MYKLPFFGPKILAFHRISQLGYLFYSSRNIRGQPTDSGSLQPCRIRTSNLGGTLVAPASRQRHSTIILRQICCNGILLADHLCTDPACKIWNSVVPLLEFVQRYFSTIVNASHFGQKRILPLRWALPIFLRLYVICTLCFVRCILAAFYLEVRIFKRFDGHDPMPTILVQRTFYRSDEHFLAFSFHMFFENRFCTLVAFYYDRRRFERYGEELFMKYFCDNTHWFDLRTTQ